MLLIFWTAFHNSSISSFHCQPSLLIMLIHMTSLSKLPPFSSTHNHLSQSWKASLSLASRFLATFRTADAARNIKFYFVSPEHTLAGRGRRWTENFFSSYGRLVMELKPCCRQLTEWVIASDLLPEYKGLRPKISLRCWQGRAGESTHCLSYPCRADLSELPLTKKRAFRLPL